MKRFFFLFLFLLSVDMISKYLTFLYVPKMSWMDTSYPFGGIGLFKGFLGGMSFSLNQVENLGAAWGAFSSHSEILFVVRILIISALILYLAFFNQIKWRRLPFLLLITGATGNILDHFIYGHVIDMLHLNFWGYTFPIFNFADALITTGVCCLMLFSFLWKKRSKVPKADSGIIS